MEVVNTYLPTYTSTVPVRVRCFRRHHQGGAGRGGRAGGAELAGIIGIATYRYCTSTISHLRACKFLALHPSKEGDSLRSYSFFLEGDNPQVPVNATYSHFLRTTAFSKIKCQYEYRKYSHTAAISNVQGRGYLIFQFSLYFVFINCTVPHSTFLLFQIL